MTKLFGIFLLALTLAVGACGGDDDEPAPDAAIAAGADAALDAPDASTSSDPDAASSSDPDAAPAAGAFGDDCTVSTDCASEVCWEFGDGTQQCTLTCSDASECPSGSQGQKCNMQGVCRT